MRLDFLSFLFSHALAHDDRCNDDKKMLLREIEVSSADAMRGSDCGVGLNGFSVEYAHVVTRLLFAVLDVWSFGCRI